MSKPEIASPKELSREELLKKLSAHGYGEAQLERLEEFQRLLQPVRVTLGQLVKAAIRGGEFTLLKSLPQTMASNVADSSGLLGVSKEQFVAVALSQPSLFYQNP